jgi:hypothetical protein
MYAVTLAIRQQARNKKAGEAPRRLSQYQMSIALRYREKPFMPNQMTDDSILFIFQFICREYMTPKK